MTRRQNDAACSRLRGWREMGMGETGRRGEQLSKEFAAEAAAV
jgi:hypothetical protein